MAIYRCEFKVYSRGKAHSAGAAAAYVTGSTVTGRGGNAGKVAVKTVSAVEAAAYRNNERLHDERSDHIHDYSRKQDVVWSGILAPDTAPDWATDRTRLWNEVEKREDRSTRPEQAQLFRECLLTIPRELSPRDQVALVRAYVQDQFVSQGMVADIGIHAPQASDGKDQPHAHVMLTLRDIGPDGFGKKRRDWNDVQWDNKTARKDGFLRQRRASWADYCNAALEDAASSARVDHRSLKARGVDRQPQPKLGKAKYAKPTVPKAQAWVDGVKAKVLDVWAHNRAIQVGKAVGKAYLKGGRQQAAQVAIAALLDEGERLTARVIGHGPDKPDHDLWGHDVG